MKLTDIFIYPVKSLGGIRLTEATVQREGLQHDRRWMLLDADGKFMTQRQVPEMALLLPEITDGHLRLSHAAGGFGEIKIPLDAEDGPALPVQVWDDQVAARPVSQQADEWFSGALGQSCQLVRMEQNAMRHNLKGMGGKFVSFADTWPYLIIGEASLADLNARLESPVPMNRFRPNFVFAGGQPFVEDSWGEFAIGNVKLENVKPCGRCILTTVDQAKGKKTGKEPLQTLSTYRRQGKKVVFGTVAKLAEGQGEEVVRVGDLFF